MKLSTKSRYGVRVLLDLAMHTDESHVSLSSVAERQDISARYLEQVAADLRKAGYIKSVKGMHGGYVLAVPPPKIIMNELLKILEGDIRLTDMPKGQETLLERCLDESLYSVLNKQVEEYFQSITLQDLLDEELRCCESGMYYI